MNIQSKLLSPAILPVYFFAVTILVGGLLLSHPISLQGQPISLLDAMFTAVSATCVTGLAVVDTGTHFSRFGHTVPFGAHSDRRSGRDDLHQPRLLYVAAARS